MAGRKKNEYIKIASTRFLHEMYHSSSHRPLYQSCSKVPLLYACLMLWASWRVTDAARAVSSENVYVPSLDACNRSSTMPLKYSAFRSSALLIYPFDSITCFMEPIS